MNLILFGFKASGKTYLGKKLSDILGKPFFDTDDLMLEAYLKEGKPAASSRELYQILGKEGFRSLEKKVIASLVLVQDSIIALGGGAILEPENERLLKHIGKLVHIDTSFTALLPRISETALGPLQPLYEQRKSLYEAISIHKICPDLLGETASLHQLALLFNSKDLSYGI